MEILAFQTIALLILAYVAGCFVGFFARGILPTRAPLTAQQPPYEGPASRHRKEHKKRGNDDLTLIKGVGPVIEKKLNRLGIKHFEQIAAWDMADVAVFDRRLNFEGHIEREDWIGQANVFVKKANP